MNWNGLKGLVATFSQPSTFNGLAGIGLLIGISDMRFQTYALAAAGFFSFIAIILKEGSGTTTSTTVTLTKEDTTPDAK
jgi:hypothetical protein